MLTKEEVTGLLLEERLSLTAFIASIVRNYHLAEDVYQDVCIKVIGDERVFESSAHLFNWARLAAKNRAIDLLRSRDGQYRGLDQHVLEELISIWPDRKTSRLQDSRQALELCLAELTANNQEILRLRYFEGRSGEEVAGRLGRKLTTIYQALTRIHRILGECVRARLTAWEVSS